MPTHDRLRATGLTGTTSSSRRRRWRVRCDHAGGRIGEAARVAGHGLEALGWTSPGRRGRCGRVRDGRLHPLPRLPVRNKVRRVMRPAPPAFSSGEALDAVGKYTRFQWLAMSGTPPALATASTRTALVEHRACCGPAVQGDGGGSPLDDRAVHDRVRSSTAGRFPRRPTPYSTIVLGKASSETSGLGPEVGQGQPCR